MCCFQGLISSSLSYKSGGAALVCFGVWEHTRTEGKVTLAAMATPKHPNSSKLQYKICAGGPAEHCRQANNPCS